MSKGDLAQHMKESGTLVDNVENKVKNEKLSHQNIFPNGAE